MKRIISVITAASISVLLLLFFGCSVNMNVLKENTLNESANILNGPYDVVRVVDGDTVVILLDGVETRVRLIGIDTPESVAPEEYYNDNVPEGRIASEYTKNLLSGKKVYLEFDIQKFDDYGRTLAYVYLEEGTMLQKILLSEGLAQIMTIQPNSKYADEFAEIQKTAREHGKGFWSY